MQIMIEISEEVYKDIIKNGFIYDEDGEEISHAIINGTPLPKNHGRIADIDEIVECINECKGEDAQFALNLIEWASEKRVLIEADREGSEAV